MKETEFIGSIDISNSQVHNDQSTNPSFITDEIILMLRTQQAFNGCGKMLQSEIDVTKKLSAR